MFEKLVPDCLSGILWRVAALAAFISASFLTARFATRIFLFLLLIAGSYLFEIASYHLQERNTFPLVFLMGMTLALGLSFVKQPKWRRIAILGLLPLLGAGLWQAASGGTQLVHNRRDDGRFFNWVSNKAPSKSIIVTDFQRDPWKLQQATGFPVFYELSYSGSIVLVEPVIPVRGVTLLGQQVDDSRNPLGLSIHRYVLQGLAHKGYRFLILEERVIQSLNENHHFDYCQIRKITDYPADSTKGLWELSFPPLVGLTYPKDLDRFLIPFKERIAS